MIHPTQQLINHYFLLIQVQIIFPEFLFPQFIQIDYRTILFCLFLSEIELWLDHIELSSYTIFQNIHLELILRLLLVFWID